MLHRRQMARLGNIIDFRTGLLDDQRVRRSQQRRGSRSSELLRIPDDRGLGEAHVAGDRVCGVVERAGGQHVNGRGLHNKGSVVPAKGHFVANLVVRRRSGRGFRERGGARAEARVNRGGFRFGFFVVTVVVVIVVIFGGGGGFGWLA